MSLKNRGGIEMLIKNKMNYKIFSNKAETAKVLAEDLYQLISKTAKNKITTRQNK
mgnify:CR=1 FL=1